MRRAALASALLLAGCDRGPAAPAPTASSEAAGAALERAAIAAGVVADPVELDPAGAYASATDRVCVVAEGRTYRVGASIDYGEGQSCLARGEASARKQQLRIDFGDDCTLDARFDGERIVFPAVVPGACERRCTGRASLSALSAERLSPAASEARAMRAPDGRALCID